MQTRCVRPPAFSPASCHQVEDADPEVVASTLLPRKETSCAPNLKRVAIVSAPVRGPEKSVGANDGDPIAEKLNESVGKALDGVVKWAAAHPSW